MDRYWVVNASPLIVLAKVGQAALLARLARVELPAAVQAEVLAAGPSDPAVRWLSSAPLPVVATAADPRVLAWNLGAGETAVLSHALASGAEAIVDDRAARNCAAALGVQVRGTLAVVVLAKQAGILPAAGPIIAELRRAGLFLADDVVRRALELAGEAG